MPFTQDDTTKKNVCDGCAEHCEFGASSYTTMRFGGKCREYYWPTIGIKVIVSYKSADGTTVSTERRAKTERRAIQLAREISKLCDNYKKKQDNQR